MLQNLLTILLFILPSSFFSQHLDSLIIDTDKLNIGFINNGIVGDIMVTDTVWGGAFEDKLFLWSGGFYLSGNNSGELWGNGVFPSELIEDYYPGKFGDKNNPKNKFYFVKSTDPDFGQSWLAWQDAVEQGASFYDGDQDGQYNPIDLNGNGVWDPGEDKPDLTGDFTAWNIFHDGVENSKRYFEDMSPLGIEIQQKVFGTISSDIPGLKNAIYINYKITNTGIITELLDSVYIALAYDFDIGEADDLTGCNISKNIGFMYNDSLDVPNWFGSTPPAAFIDLLQGPHSYIPGVTFNDNNENGIYDDGIDVPLDSAIIKRGPNKRLKAIPGAKNLEMTSFSIIQKSVPGRDEPRNAEELRNYAVGGKTKHGSQINIRELNIGNGHELGSAADTISNMYLFSGNPVDGTGWLNTSPFDYRILVNSGPFNLKVDQPVEIMFAVLVGRGSDNLNSITEAYKIDEKVQQQYDNNFTDFPVGVDDKKPEELPNEIVLHQNYPNPFNPSTVIEIELPKREEIDLSVYNVLGQKVTTLFNGVKNAGRHSFVLNAGDFASQVLIAVLKSGDTIISKKMMMLK